MGRRVRVGNGVCVGRMTEVEDGRRVAVGGFGVFVGLVVAVCTGGLTVCDDVGTGVSAEKGVLVLTSGVRVGAIFVGGTFV